MILKQRTPIERVEWILKHTVIPKIKRKNIDDGLVRTVTMGQVNRPFHTFKGHSKFTEQHPELWEALQQLADHLDPNHRWTSVTINHNVICKPHRDVRNDGTTMIIGLGDYTGGELVIDDVHFDINHRVHYFNGYLHTHYNLPHTGERWSLMFYSLRKSWDIEHRNEDLPIIREVYHGNQYHNRSIGFGIERGDHWIDIGAHIGCWTKKCHYYGATTTSYEPDPDNFVLLTLNAAGSECHNVAVGAVAGRGTIIKGNKAYFNKVQDDPDGATKVVAFQDILTDGCCVKMDIEGGELDILDLDLDQCDFGQIRKMVFAYHINCDRSRTNFLRRMDRLRQWFDVYHQEIKTETMNFFPNEVMVYCIKKT